LLRFDRLFTYVPDISAALAAATDFITLFDSRPSIDATLSTGHSPSDKQSTSALTLDNIHFTYPSRPTVPVLKGLTLTAKPGTFIALVGESGCGKSTVIQLIERFYDPSQGSVRMDGTDVRDFDVSGYRNSISLVSQEPVG
jgi:ATP-binding cassette, subfamily B (MDR/TAP), member 1